MTAYLFDTSAVIDLLEAAPGTTFSHTLEDESFISVITLAELTFGVQKQRGLRRNQWEDRYRAARRQWPHPVPVDEEVVDAYAYVAAAVLDAGRNPRTVNNDALIAATARSIGATVVTANLKHFAGLEEVVPVEAFVVTPGTVSPGN